MSRIMLNGFYIVELKEEHTVHSNGLTVKETRGKRDIVTGVIKNLPDGTYGIRTGDLIYFPLYAGNPITIDGKTYLSIHEDDIIMVEKEEH